MSRAWRRRPGALLAALLVALGGQPAVSGVSARGAGGFVVEHTLNVKGTPELVYRALTDGIGAWWNPDHSYSGDAANFSLGAQAGGCFCESLPGGGSVEHMRVVFAQPGTRLRLAGGLGPLQPMGASGTMEFALEADGDSATRLTLRYTVSGWAPDGLAAIADPVDAVLGEQLARLAAYLDGRTPNG